jgi:hypothetical protein
VFFTQKIPILGEFWWGLQWNMLVYFTDFGLFYGQPVPKFYDHLVYVVVIWYIFPHFGIWYQEKSGNPERQEGMYM